MDWKDLAFDPERLPLKICLVGFAPSRDQTPWTNTSIDEFWLCNDLYAHTPNRDDSRSRTFEIHATESLTEQGRRNPAYFNWLQKGKHPVYMAEPRPEWPSSIRFPFDWLLDCFPRRYFTNSIAFMQALAIMVLTEVVEVSPGRVARLARPGAELAMFGIDMAASSEVYTFQRACCEYFVGLAEAAGIAVFIPDTSDLLKSGGVYGRDTTLPMRKKLELKMAQVQQSEAQIDQQLVMLGAQKEQLMHQKGVMNGQKEAFAYIRSIWTNPTEVAPSAEERAQRHGTDIAALPSSFTAGNGNAKVTDLARVEG